MAVPTVASVTPDVGHTGGKTLVEIQGSNFALPVPWSGPGPAPPRKPSVAVTVGGVAAAEVWVATSEVIYILTPQGAPGAPVDLVVQNLDAAGAPVSGEVATAVDAFTFMRPNLNEMSELARVVGAFIEQLKLQVHDNVHFSTHTDYDSETGDVVSMADVGTLPALILGQVEVPEDPAHRVQEETTVEVSPGYFIKRRPAVAVDVSATLIGVTNNPIQLLNLMQAVRMFFKKTPWLVVNRYADDPSRGSVKYELDWSFGGPVSVSHQGDNSNVESFGGAVIIRGVLLEDMPGITRIVPGVALIPEHLPHEATVGIGAVSASDASAVQTATEPKPVT